MLYPVCIVKYFPQPCIKLELHVKETEYAEDTFRLRAFAMHLAHEEQPSHFESVVGRLPFFVDNGLISCHPQLEFVEV